MNTFFYRAALGFGTRCAQGGEPKQPGGPSGWAYGFTQDSEFQELTHNTDPAVVAAFRNAYEQDPCGVSNDFATAIALNTALAQNVEVPVLLLYGDRDVFMPGAGEAQRAHYPGSDDVSLEIMADTGHMMMLGRTAPAFRQRLSVWLTARGF